MASHAVYLLDLLGRQHRCKRRQCRHLALPVHAHAQLCGDHLQIAHADEDERRLHGYGEAAIVLKHSCYSPGLRPALACVGRRLSVIDFHAVVANPYSPFVVVLRIDAEHATGPNHQVIHIHLVGY